MSLSPLPDWITPPAEGYSALDLDHLPDLPPLTELIDGGLVFVSPHRKFHSRVVQALLRAFGDAVPTPWAVDLEMSVVLETRQRLIPDVLIAKADFGGNGTAWYPPEAVLLVVEVVSPESEVRDRERKPQLYARAGIKHFWLVEEVDGRAVVYASELNSTTRAYSPGGIYHGTFTTDVPFPIEIDLDGI